MALATVTTIRPMEVWMILKDLKQLKKLMLIQDDISGRQLARVAGYKSHTYMQRILRGEVKTLDPEPALRISKHFGVGVDDLFLVGSSMKPVELSQNVEKGSRGRAAG